MKHKVLLLPHANKASLPLFHISPGSRGLRRTSAPAGQAGHHAGTPGRAAWRRTLHSWRRAAGVSGDEGVNGYSAGLSLVCAAALACTRHMHAPVQLLRSQYICQLKLQFHFPLSIAARIAPSHPAPPGPWGAVIVLSLELTNPLHPLTSSQPAAPPPTHPAPLPPTWAAVIVLALEFLACHNVISLHHQRLQRRARRPLGAAGGADGRRAAAPTPRGGGWRWWPRGDLGAASILAPARCRQCLRRRGGERAAAAAGSGRRSSAAGPVR